jgi:hypothetical protein
MRRDTAQDDLVGAMYEKLIRDICDFDWSSLTADDLIDVAWAYYYFSVQFRENLEIALALYPDDARLRQLDQGERNTDNLSPWPGVAEAGEKMDHDEFIRKTLTLTAINEGRQRRLAASGEAYLAAVRSLDGTSRALSIASYENGGLAAVFRSILKAQCWDGPLLQAFRHFLTEHIKFDSDPEHGHGALCLHLPADDRVLPLWQAFRQMLVEAVPGLTRSR